MIRKLLKNQAIMQFVSYVFVGGMAALVEWILFYVFQSVIGINYLVSTVLAFIFSTFTNWILGRLITFREKAQDTRKLKEAVMVYLISGIGLGFNLLLMYLFVDVIQIMPLIGKITATGIVFFWNFFARKFGVYR